MRKIWAIAIFFVYFDAAAVLLEATGVTAAWGVESPTGVTTAIGNAQEGVRQIQASGGLSDTLFGSFAAAAGGAEALGRVLVAGPLLLTSAGIPGEYVAFLFSPVIFIVARGIYHALTGRFA